MAASQCFPSVLLTYVKENPVHTKDQQQALLPGMHWLGFWSVMSLKSKNYEVEQIRPMQTLSSYSKKLMSSIQCTMHPAIQQPELGTLTTLQRARKHDTGHKNKGMGSRKRSNDPFWLPGIDRNKLLQWTGSSEHVPSQLQKGRTEDCIYKCKSLTEFLQKCI